MTLCALLMAVIFAAFNSTYGFAMAGVYLLIAGTMYVIDRHTSHTVTKEHTDGQGQD